LNTKCRKVAEWPMYLQIMYLQIEGMGENLILGYY